jgi:hypothetical protein
VAPLEEQARLADSGLGHRRDNLPASSLGLIRRTLERFHFRLPTHELRQAAPRRVRHQDMLADCR